MKNKLIIFFSFLFLTLFSAGFAKAVCPVCVVAIGAGLGLSRWLGVDDVISSIWIGGLLWGVSVWTVVWLRGKNWGFKYDSWVVTIAYYVLVLGPLFYSDLIGHPINKIWGIDKILFGTIIGTAVFIGANYLHGYLKSKNENKSYFPYQKVVVPVVSLIIISLIFFTLIIWKII